MKRYAVAVSGEGGENESLEIVEGGTVVQYLKDKLTNNGEYPWETLDGLSVDGIVDEAGDAGWGILIKEIPEVKP